MLNACACGRQYDVTHRQPGDRVLCDCGIRFRVEFRAPHSPKALRCSDCGGNLKSDARFCSYCSAEVTLEERRLSSVCPKCFARASLEANFCMECGLRIEPQALAALPTEADCPRCESKLRQRMLGTAGVAECGSCGGLWLSEEHFDRVCDQADEAELASRGLASMGSPSRPGRAEQVRYLPCVECKDLMIRRNYAQSSGIIIDVCRQHGVWLDHAELEHILTFVREGGLDRARVRQIERLKDQERRTRNAPGPISMHPTSAGREVNLDVLRWVHDLVQLFGFLRR